MKVVVAKMPSLVHWDRNQPFDIMKSEVVEWLIKQPDVRQFLFDRVKGTGMITFDEKLGKWRGVDDQACGPLT